MPLEVISAVQQKTVRMQIICLSGVHIIIVMTFSLQVQASIIERVMFFRNTFFF